MDNVCSAHSRITCKQYDGHVPGSIIIFLVHMLKHSPDFVWRKSWDQPDSRLFGQEITKINLDICQSISIQMFGDEPQCTKYVPHAAFMPVMRYRQEIHYDIISKIFIGETVFFKITEKLPHTAMDTPSDAIIVTRIVYDPFNQPHAFL